MYLNQNRNDNRNSKQSSTGLSKVYCPRLRPRVGKKRNNEHHKRICITGFANKQPKSEKSMKENNDFIVNEMRKILDHEENSMVHYSQDSDYLIELLKQYFNNIDCKSTYRVCKNMSIESDFDSNFLYNKQ
jgi:hypothetical protein